VIAPEIVNLGVLFYDALTRQGYPNHESRPAAVCYMRRKEVEPTSSDAMPYFEALADALAQRAALKLKALRRRK
jgi:hypothetical protein